ncbi:hypothetical protein [Actinomycetospora flava]|uniref:Uncharacterized protein n=1 Tax=Actinomycetospora flava TaxID=3129232 RepID=A0ABU8M7P0_9PSEU
MSNSTMNAEPTGPGTRSGSPPLVHRARSPITRLINGLGTAAGAIGVVGSILLAAQWGATGYDGLNGLSFWALVAFFGGLISLMKFVGWVDDWEEDFTPIVGTFVVLYALAGVFFMVTLANVIWDFT